MQNQMVRIVLILSLSSSTALAVPAAANVVPPVASIVDAGIPPAAQSVFPAPESCQPFKKELQFLKGYYDQGVSYSQSWLKIANQHEDVSRRWDSILGANINKPAVQATALLGTATVGLGVAKSFVPKKLLIVGVIAAGALIYVFYDRIFDWRRSLDVERQRALTRIDYFNLVKTNQDYDRDFIWPEQVERFKRLVQLNSQSMGLPTYKGGYQKFPIQDLPQILAQQFSYFTYRTELLYKGFKQLESLPQESNLYVRLAIQQHDNDVKGRMAEALYQTYDYQARLAFETASALSQSCGIAPVPAQP